MSHGSHCKNRPDARPQSCQQSHREVVQALAGDTADVHAGTLADGLETFQHGNTVGIIRIGWCHNKKSFQKVVAR